MNLKLKKISEIKLQDECYYLVQNYEWSASGYTIARYDAAEGALVCETCNRSIPFNDILGIVQLNTDCF